jgi:hypothetical protein
MHTRRSSSSLISLADRPTRSAAFFTTCTYCCTFFDLFLFFKPFHIHVIQQSGRLMI